MGIVVGLFLFLCLLTITLPIPNVPATWRIGLIFAIVWFILFVFEKAGYIKLP